MVLFVLALGALLAITGIVIDGGRAYSNRRQVQNVADAASLAGTYELNRNFGGQSTPEKILQKVQAKISENKANGALTCEITDEAGTVLQPCPTTAATALAANADGVKVTIGDSRNTEFIRVVGINSFTTSANATATVQALRGGVASPFLMCGLTQPQGGQNGMDATTKAPLTPPAPILLDTNPALPRTNGSKWIVNTGQQSPTYQSAIGKRYVIHDQQVPTCFGGGSGFKGWAQQGEEATLPGWWDTQTGTRAGPARSVIAGQEGCETNLNNCIIVVPICVQSNGDNGASYDLYCVKFGSFKIIDTGGGNSGSSHDGIFLGEAVVSEGKGGGKPVSGEARLIRLFQ